MQDSTFHPGLCGIKYHQFQGIISCGISPLAHSSQKELEVELYNHQVHLLVRHAISFCSHVSHSRQCNQCARRGALQALARHSSPRVDYHMSGTYRRESRESPLSMLRLTWQMNLSSSSGLNRSSFSSGQVSRRFGNLTECGSHVCPLVRCTDWQSRGSSGL